MTLDDSRDYYAERADQARNLADHAALPQVRRIHLDMANRYALLSGGEIAGRPVLSIVAGER